MINGKMHLLAMAAALSAAAQHLTEVADADTDDGEDAAPVTGKAPKPAKAAVPAGTKPTPKGKGRGRAAPSTTVTEDDLREKVTAYIKDAGRDKAIALLTRFGVEKLGELQAEQYDEFNEYLDKCIAGDEDPEQAEGGEGEDLLG